MTHYKRKDSILTEQQFNNLKAINADITQDMTERQALKLVKLKK